MHLTAKKSIKNCIDRGKSKRLKMEVHANNKCRVLHRIPPSIPHSPCLSKPWELKWRLKLVALLKSTEFTRKRHPSHNSLRFTLNHASGIECSPNLSVLTISDFPLASSSNHWTTGSLRVRTTQLQFWSW
jgi:hypothetical protein